MQLIHLVYPVLSAATLIIMFSAILLRRLYRYSKMASEDRYLIKYGKFYDENENLWWDMTTAVVLFTYVGFIILATKPEIGKFSADWIFIGILIWLVLYAIGRKLNPKSVNAAPSEENK